MGAPGNSGLKGQWGVGNPSDPQSSQDAAPQDTGSDEQAREFQAAFKAVQAEINGHLQYTSVNAEAGRNATFTSRRDALYSAFQSALGKIDRNDPSKAQGDIDRVLGDARTLSSEVGAFRQETEQAKAEWDSRQASFDEAVHHVEELETWEDPQAAGLRGKADETRTHTNERRWREACSALDGLLPALQPVYEEYLKQREAKPQYEQKVAEQSARLEALKGAEKPSQPMTAKAGEADAALQEAKGKADTKDYVGGSEGMDRVGSVADELDQLTNDPQRQQYLTDSQGLAQQSTPQPEPAFQVLDADWAAISEAEARAQPMADAGDYGGANQALADSKAKREQFLQKQQELAQAKQEYETAVAALQPRLQAVSVCDPQYAELEPMLQELATAQGQMEASAQAEDYAQALAQVQDLTTKVDAIEQARAEIDQKKQEYETAWAALQPRVQDISVSDPAYAGIEPQLQEIAQAQSAMEASAQAGDYDQANTQLQDLTTKVDAYEQAKTEIDQKKQEYETAWAALQPRVQDISVSDPAYAGIEPQLQEIAQAQSAMEASAQAGDYDQANTQLQDLTTKVDAYEQAKTEIDQQRQDYETLRALVEPRIAEAAKKQYLNLAKQLEAIKKLQREAAAAADAGDFVKARQSMQQASDQTDAYVTAADKEVEPPIMGSAQAGRADEMMKKLPEADQKAVQALVDNAKSEAEKQFLLKGVAAGHSAAELKEFAKKIEGKDETWMRDNLNVTGSSKGTGVKQQWSMSCNATAAQAVKAQMDPLYALKLHEENPDLDQADNNDAMAKNPKLAQEQKDMLTSNYTGARGAMSGGQAVNRSGPAATGRWNDDLLNNNSDSTGITYAPKDVGTGMSVNDAISNIDSGTSKGQPVPIVIGDNGSNKNAHYVVVTGMGKGPPKQYTIHDPGSGQTVVRTEDDIKNGKINLSGWNHLAAIEDPSTKPVAK